jgi:hypothetical protein
MRRYAGHKIDLSRAEFPGHLNIGLLSNPPVYRLMVFALHARSVAGNPPPDSVQSCPAPSQARRPITRSAYGQYLVVRLNLYPRVLMTARSVMVLQIAELQRQPARE